MLLEMAADGLGDRVAIGPRDAGLTFADLRQLAVTIGEHLASTDADAVALVTETSPLVPAVLFGAAWAGVSYAPINYRLPKDARDALLARLEPVVVADESWIAMPGASEGPFVEDPKRPAVLLFTSGTSAEPKVAVLEHDQLLAYQLNTMEFAAAGADEAVLLAVPPFHIAGVTAVLTSTYAGRRIVPLPRFTPEEWLETATRERVTHAFVVPTMLTRIVHALEEDPSLRPPTLRALSYGGARMPTPVLERALELLPDTGFVNAYGLTETSSTVCILGPDDHRRAVESDEPAVRARLASAGRPVPGIEVRIVNVDGTVVTDEGVGEIHLRGAQVSGQYVGLGSTRDDDEWLATGDFGWLDVEGYLHVEGRGDDTIIRGGENIGAAEVEDALLHHPAVDHAAVVGVPDEEWGEQIAAMVSLRPGATADEAELQEHVRQVLGSFKTPQTIAIRDELPQTATGKILRRTVRTELTARR